MGEPSRRGWHESRIDGWLADMLERREEGGGLMVSFYVFGEPISQGSLTSFNDAHGNVRTKHSNATRLKPWRQIVADVAQRHASMLSGAVTLRCTFDLPRPKSLAKALLPPMTKRPDLSKLVRAVEDALTSVMYHDDSQVVEIVAKKRYADVDGPIGVLIELEEECA